MKNRMTERGLVTTVVLKQMQRFLKMESASGLLLMMTAALAIIVANSPLQIIYRDVLATEISISIGRYVLMEPVLLWINDGLMALFFLLVSLEIKREFMRGQLSSPDQALLPCLAALGGVVVPALIYVYFAQGNPEALRGWAVPSATDIAFSLGVISLLGKRVPISLKIFLTTLAVMDDLAAIVIIAAFYTDQISPNAGWIAFGCVLVLALLNRSRIRNMPLWLLVGLVLWLAVLKSGVHATLAGVIFGFFVPLKQRDEEEGPSMLNTLEHALHPWVAFAIMPLFAFANAGLSLDGMHANALLDPVTIGIILGLFVGKPVGIWGVTWLAVQLKLARKPIGADWYSILAMAWLGGIGFTMSLFIASLAFRTELLQAEARLGILVGSVASALVGYAMFRLRRLPENAAN